MTVKSVFFQFKKAIILIVCFSVFSCKNSTNEKIADTYISEMDFKSDDLASDIEAKAKPQRHPKDIKIIKSAHVKYKVNDVKNTTNIFKKLISEYDGYVSDLKFQNNLYQKENTFTAKIPRQYFDTILDTIAEHVEFIDFEEVSTKDVSEEYIDISKRLKTKIEIRNRYESILREKAKTVEDVLAVEEKLRQIQEEIESSQGRLNYLNNKVSFSSINITLYETVEYIEEPKAYEKRFITRVKEGFTFGWDIIETVFISLIYVWPFSLIVILILALRKKITKKIFK